MDKAYSIKHASQKTGLTEDSIRYYEKIGLLQDVKRKENGHRIYHTDDLELMELIICLKKSGMPLKDMKKVIQFPFKKSVSSVPELKSLLLVYRQQIIDQISDLNERLTFIDTKLDGESSLLAPYKRDKTN